ncbi:MAG: hypothetical protein M3R43_11215 [Acidobacteriota bacterium]|nr:hypothetical protein [Acidobacteriota bacterium]
MKIMKIATLKWTGVAVLACVVVCGPWRGKAQATTKVGQQVKDDLFAGTEKFAQGASSATEINMGPETLGLVAGDNSPKARRTVLSVVRSYTYDKPGMYKMEDVEEFRKKLEGGDWSCSVHVRELKSGESTDVCNRHRTDDLTESAIITVEPKSLTFIHTIRRKSASGQSESSDFMLMNSLPGLPALAMIEPQLLSLRMSLDNLPMLDSGEMELKLNSAMKKLHMIDSADMQKRMAEAQKQLGEVAKRMKDLQTPEMQQKLEDAIKHSGVTKDIE